GRAPGGCPDLCKHLAAQIVTITEKSIGMIMSGHFHGSKRSPPTPASTPACLRRERDRRVRVIADAGEDDGHSWRKYGQKEILGAQHPKVGFGIFFSRSLSSSAPKSAHVFESGHTTVARTGKLRDARDRRCSAPTRTQRSTRDLPRHARLHKDGGGQRTAGDAEPGRGSLLKSLSSSLTVNTGGPHARPQQSTPFSFSSPSVSGLTAPPEHYTFSTRQRLENCFGQGVLALAVPS
ncbi:hypothetical protein QYE76_007986, partial [Lolium multiflorum]